MRSTVIRNWLRGRPKLLWMDGVIQGYHYVDGVMLAIDDETVSLGCKGITPEAALQGANYMIACRRSHFGCTLTCHMLGMGRTPAP